VVVIADLRREASPTVQDTMVRCLVLHQTFA
jgi:hypothetical protein